VNRRIKIVCRGCLAIAVALAGFVGGVWYWYYHRPLPPVIRHSLFEGVTYAREVRHSPRPMVIHVVTIRLDAPGIGFLVTPGDPKQRRPLHARTTSQFLSEFKVQVAVNGDFFFPWWSRALWDYYPHAGDPVELEGFAASRGVVYSTHPIKNHFPRLYISKDNRILIGKPSARPYNVLSGNPVLLRHGENLLAQKPPDRLEPRTAIAVDREGKRLFLVVIDGRQPNYSEGATAAELADILRQHGGYDALNLDGGGSTTLVVEGRDGKPEILNSPIDNHIPGHERPVANHLGVFARRLTSQHGN
jgi:hypothetical protein